jgi:hypothetical protein
LKRLKRTKESQPDTESAETVAAAETDVAPTVSRRKRDSRARGREHEPASGTVERPSWMRDHELPPLVCDPGPGGGVVNLPAADGYHFGDDHTWGAKQQSALVTRLEELEESIPSA